LFNLPPTEIATQEPIRFGPGSAHPGTTGEVRIELEGYLLGGDHHARAAIWDMAVDDKTGELYVLSVPRIKSYSELRVYDRQGRYLRTVMPLDPTLPSADVKDLCRSTAVEDGVELVMPKVFQMQPVPKTTGSTRSFLACALLLMSYSRSDRPGSIPSRSRCCGTEPPPGTIRFEPTD